MVMGVIVPIGKRRRMQASSRSTSRMFFPRNAADYEHLLLQQQEGVGKGEEKRKEDPHLPRCVTFVFAFVRLRMVPADRWKKNTNSERSPSSSRRTTP